MEREVIHQLLEKYYAGETTEHEEAVLIDWFASERVPDGLRADRLLFEQVYGLSPLVDPGRIEERMARRIDGWNSVERSILRRTRGATLRWTAGIAASVLLLCTVGLALHHRGESVGDAQTATSGVLKDTYDNPEQAYAMTEAALMEFSRHLNKGLKTMSNDKP